MELKLYPRIMEKSRIDLLIVPYGIETIYLAQYLQSRNGLLIVPYGIETKVTEEEAERLLLLIVPYGIETRQSDTDKRGYHAFNRTLWN